MFIFKVILIGLVFVVGKTVSRFLYYFLWVQFQHRELFKKLPNAGNTFVSECLLLVCCIFSFCFFFRISICFFLFSLVFFFLSQPDRFPQVRSLCLNCSTSEAMIPFWPSFENFQRRQTKLFRQSSTWAL